MLHKPCFMAAHLLSWEDVDARVLHENEQKASQAFGWSNRLPFVQGVVGGRLFDEPLILNTENVLTQHPVARPPRAAIDHRGANHSASITSVMSVQNRPYRIAQRSRRVALELSTDWNSSCQEDRVTYQSEDSECIPRGTFHGTSTTWWV